MGISLERGGGLSKKGAQGGLTAVRGQTAGRRQTILADPAIGVLWTYG